MFTFTWHLSLSHRRRWKPAQAHCGWGSNSLPPATMFKITGHCLHCYTGLAGSRTVLSELRTQLPTVHTVYSVQYSVQVYSAVYYWCTVDTWSLHAVRTCAVHTTASYVNIDRAYYVCPAGRIGRIRIRVSILSSIPWWLHNFWRVPAFASLLSETIKTLLNGCFNYLVWAFSKYLFILCFMCGFEVTDHSAEKCMVANISWPKISLKKLVVGLNGGKNGK